MSLAARARESAGTVAALAVTVALAAAAYAALGSRLRGPSVFGDELIYFDAARAVADGGRPLVRGEAYGFGPVYPVLLAPLVELARSATSAYALAKAANAIFFALAAIPAYLLARRLLGRTWSLAAAALSVALPSALYTGLVLTESVAYATACWALLASMLVLERPTARRQLGAVAAVAVAAAARQQLAVLAPALVLALGLRWAALPTGTRPGRGALVRLWPLGAALAAGALVGVVLPWVRGDSPLGGYSGLWRGYEVVDVARWTWYGLAGLGLYLAFVPLVVMPVALVLLLRRGREGSHAAAAFASLFVAVNVVLLLVVGAFSSTPFGEGRLHDRYLFYVVPLWLVLVISWVRERTHAPAPIPAVAGALLGLAAAVSLPLRLLARDGAVQLDGVATAVWATLGEQRPGSVRPALVVAALTAVVVAGLPGRLRSVALAAVTAAFLGNAAIVWHLRIADADRNVLGGTDRAAVEWVDRATRGDPATILYVSTSTCPSDVREAFLWTEFFNASVGPGAHVGAKPSNGVPSTEVKVRADGTLVQAGGTVLEARDVVAPPGVSLRGRLLATGTASRLTLWQVDGPVRLNGIGSDAMLVERACAGAD